MVFPATKQDVEDHFNTHGAGKIKEIKLKAGFGFIEYDDEMDAKDVVPGETFSLAFASSEFPANFMPCLSVSYVSNQLRLGIHCLTLSFHIRRQ